MFCIKCGKEIGEGAKFCRYCGNKQDDNGIKMMTEPVQPIYDEIQIPEHVDTGGVVSESYNRFLELYQLVGLKLVEDAVDESFEILKPYVDKRDPEALTWLGIIALEKKSDFSEAMQHFKEALQLGSAQAAEGIARIYATEEYPGYDKNKAFRFFKASAEMGSSDGMSKTAFCYYLGFGIQEDKRAAYEWAVKANETYKREDALLVLAASYEDGEVVERNLEKAIYWWKMRLECTPNFGYGMYRMACCLADPFDEFGIAATQEEEEKAYEWAQKSIKNGEPAGYLVLAYFTAKGKVVQQNIENARQLVIKAIEEDCEEGKIMLKQFRRNIYGDYYFAG